MIGSQSHTKQSSVKEAEIRHNCCAVVDSDGGATVQINFKI